ncbi:MAG: chorismate synthase [Bulleidia sp.]
MKNVLGNNLTLTLFGESHGKAIGGVLDGYPAGVHIDMDLVESMMARRRAAGTISTGRREADVPEFLSGIRNGISEGTPIAFVIANQSQRSNDYNALANIARPGHADYTGHIHYLGFEDASGGGHFSGRLTAVMTAAGALCMCMLRERGIDIGTHILSLHGIADSPFDENRLQEQIASLHECGFPVINQACKESMIAEIEEARHNLDSVGGILDTAVIGLPAGLGDPEFDSLESQLAHAMFSIPAVKGIQFGKGFDFAGMRGSQANDPFEVKDGKVVTATNNNGGINGGITNGMPVRFSTVIKPTPSIARKQKTVNFETMENTEVEIHGRHDPAIIHRAAVVQEAMSAIVIADALMTRYGQIHWRNGE